MSQTPPEPAKAVHPAAKLAIEAGPLVVFFVTNSIFDTGSGDGIFKATAAFMIAITISLVASWKLERRLNALLDGGTVDLVLPIDYPGLNLRITRAAKARGIPVLYYIAPQVWAWRARRARQLAEDADRIAVVRYGMMGVP